MVAPPASVRWTALSLVSLQVFAQVTIGSLISLMVARPSLGQTPLPPASAPSDLLSRPTALELLEQARQRLRDRGELPPLSAPPPTDSQAADQTPSPDPAQSFDLYRLGPGDVVSVFVQRFQEFSFQAAIDPEGKITHPILGKIALQGLTIEEAQAKVQQAVSRFVINPVVLLSLGTQRPVQVTVVGEIVRPGLYPLLLGNQRVSSALLAAGGATDRADLRSVKVRRTMNTQGNTADETLDLYTPLKTGTSLPDLRLQDGDVVIIPPLKPGDDKDYDRGLIAKSTLVKPQITVRVLSYDRNGLSEVVVPNGSKFVDALARAGVNPDSANLTRIGLVRFDPVQQKAITLHINGKKALMGDPSQNVALQDNDVVIVGRNLVGRVTYALNVFTQPFRDVLGFLLFFRELSNSATNLFSPSSSSSSGN